MVMHDPYHNRGLHVKVTIKLGVTNFAHSCRNSRMRLQSLQQYHGSEYLQEHEHLQPQSSSQGWPHVQSRLPTLVANGSCPGSELMRHETGQPSLTSLREAQSPARDKSLHEANKPLVLLETIESGMSSGDAIWADRAVQRPMTRNSAVIDEALMVRGIPVCLRQVLRRRDYVKFTATVWRVAKEGKEKRGRPEAPPPGFLE